MSNALVYCGTRIRDREELVCLTDMWRAAGADDSKRPSDWLAQPVATEFVSHIAGLLNASISGIIISERGRSGATWAHWQIGLAYAKYLSPDFHAWCNEVVRRHMELARSAPPSIAALDSLFDRKLEPIHQGMAELRRDSAQMRCEIVDMKGNLLEVHDRLNKVVKQTQFSKWARKQFVFVVHKRYQGFCPCCRDNKIVDDYGREIDTKSSHADHFHGPENNKVEDGWLVCAKCNYRLYRDPAFKEKAKPHFRVYQDYRFDIFGNGKQQSPRKQRQSTTVLHSKQFSMKFD